MAGAPDQALATVPGTAVTFKANGENVTLSFDDVRRYLCPAANDQECKLFIELCRYNGFNPFLREAYLIKYDKNSSATMVVGKDAFTKRAEEYPAFDGFEAGLVVFADGRLDYREGSAAYPGEEIVGGWAKVYRKDRTRPYYEEVSLTEYDKKQSKWKESPGTMIRKVALVHALREAFPSTFGGLYAPEEVGADLEGSFREVEGEPVPPPANRSRRAIKRLAEDFPTAADDPFAAAADEPAGGDLS
ncbi:MAG: phage recombination protein Bet [Faecalibacterium sp.]|nr:phage recombination protein Bet [Faecalibacterium sp.]